MSGAGRPDRAAADAAGLSLAIVATRWHQEITDSLVTRGIAAAIACGISDPLWSGSPARSSYRSWRPNWPGTTTR